MLALAEEILFRNVITAIDEKLAKSLDTCSYLNSLELILIEPKLIGGFKTLLARNKKTEVGYHFCRRYVICISSTFSPNNIF